MQETGSKIAHTDGAGTRQLIGFRLGSEQFAVAINSISEIVKLLPISAVPDLPNGFSGVARLREQVILVADLYARFGIPPGPATKDSRLMVLDGHTRRVGIPVDAVSEVIHLSTAQITPSSILHSGISDEFVQAVGRWQDQLVTVLDLGGLCADPQASPTSAAINDQQPTPEDQPAPGAPAATADDPNADKEQLMDLLGKQADNGVALYQDVGELARFINQAHLNLAESIQQESSINVTAKDLPTAHEMLQRVTEETETATMAVMSHTEETTRTLDDVRNMVAELEECTPANSDKQTRVADLADRIRAELDNIETVQTDTIMALSFQDLTGQKIKQVISLMNQVEERILRLVVEYGIANAPDEIAPTDQDQMLKDTEKSGLRQTNVDDILAEFGF